MDGRFDAVLSPWVERYGEGVLTDSRFDKWPVLKARRDVEVLPYLRARWAVLAAGLWIVYLILWMLFMRFAAKSSNTPDPPKENKNPYSVGNKKGPAK